MTFKIDMTSPMHLFMDAAAKDDPSFPSHEYASLLLAEGLEFNDELRYITKNDLADVGVKSAGHRLRIIRAIREHFGAPEVEFDFPAEGAVSFQNPLAAAAASAPAAPAVKAASSAAAAASSSSSTASKATKAKK